MDNQAFYKGKIRVNIKEKLGRLTLCVKTKNRKEHFNRLTLCGKTENKKEKINRLTLCGKVDFLFFILSSENADNPSHYSSVHPM